MARHLKEHIDLTGSVLGCLGAWVPRPSPGQVEPSSPAQVLRTLYVLRSIGGFDWVSIALGETSLQAGNRDRCISTIPTSTKSGTAPFGESLGAWLTGPLACQSLCSDWYRNSPGGSGGVTRGHRERTGPH